MRSWLQFVARSLQNLLVGAHLMFRLAPDNKLLYRALPMRWLKKQYTYGAYRVTCAQLVGRWKRRMRKNKVMQIGRNGEMPECCWTRKSHKARAAGAYSVMMLKLKRVRYHVNAWSHVHEDKSLHALPIITTKLDKQRCLSAAGIMLRSSCILDSQITVIFGC